MPSVFEKFSRHCRAALTSAGTTARRLRAELITPAHVLYGVASERGSIGAEVLLRSKLTPTRIRPRLAKRTVTAKPAPDFSASAQRIIAKATLMASRLGHRYVGTEHLLSSLLESEDSEVRHLFTQLGVNRRQLNDRLAIVMKSTSRFPDLVDALENPMRPGRDDVDEGVGVATQTRGGLSALETYATHLTDESVQRTIDPVIGRDAEIERVVQILCRRTKNNPLLLGDPGVGKTAIVEGLAKRILQDTVPDALLNKRIYALDLGLLVAGSSFRGEFENRLKHVLAAVKRDRRIILFIDEIHTIVGAGSATGSMDAANLLKPSLARGEIRCIGATTPEEYKRHIENDPALERRFQVVTVAAPSVPQTIEILRGLRANYERYHGVSITDEALESAVSLSQRYLHDRFLPDKAIDLIDEAAARVRLNRPPSAGALNLRTLEEELKTIQDKLQRSVNAEQFSAALQLRAAQDIVHHRLAALQASPADTGIAPSPITGEHVAAVVGAMTGVPVSTILESEHARLQKLEDQLTRRVVGQPEAVSAVAAAIRRARLGINDSRRPIGSFLFLGPTGVGKTELAKAVAESVFGSADALVRIDGAELAEGFTISKLVGSPAGYVGYRDPTKLTDRVKQRPYSVVLFDEIEKAHPQVAHLLLSILEDGVLMDATGRSINFRNTVIILTSNLGAETYQGAGRIGFSLGDVSATGGVPEEVERRVRDAARAHFRPEFISRLDSLVVFRPLTTEAIGAIVRLQLDELARRLRERKITLEVSEPAIEHLASKSHDPKLGGRAVRTQISQLVETPLTKHLLDRPNQHPQSVRLRVSRGTLAFA